MLPRSTTIPPPRFSCQCHLYTFYSSPLHSHTNKSQPNSVLTSDIYSKKRININRCAKRKALSSSLKCPILPCHPAVTMHVSHHAAPYHTMPRPTTPCCALLYHAAPYYTTLRPITPCSALLHYAQPYYTMLRPIIPRCALLYHVTQP